MLQNILNILILHTICLVDVCIFANALSLSLSLSINILVLFFSFLCSFPILPCTLLKLTSPLICTMSAYKDQEPRLHGIKTKIRVVPNFPKSGSFCPFLIFSLFFLCFYFGLRNQTTLDSLKFCFSSVFQFLKS